MSADLPQIEEFQRLFVNDIPLLDVRAPVEYNAGAFPQASNLPLINDQERHLIGIHYQDEGQDAAVALGHELVNGPAKAARIAAWIEYAKEKPDAVLYCFRGGMRSRISQHWLYEESGILVPRVRGGYKALRGFLLDELDRAAGEIEPVLIGGRTGVGKTLLLRKIRYALDLENLAWHRGSAFGRHATAQPTQVDFENELSIELLKHRRKIARPIVIEDESKNIGSRHLPNRLWETLSAAPCVILEASLEQRVEITLQEYVRDALAEYQGLYGREEGCQRWSAHLLDSLNRIRKRLGAARHQDLRKLLETALKHQRTTDDIGLHRAWIAVLLSDYYDPMYDYQLTKKRHRICFVGDATAVVDYLKTIQAPR